MKTPARNSDLRHVKTGLSAMERHEAILEGRRLQQIRELGDAYLLHPSKAPAKGVYNALTGMRLA